MWFLTFSLSSIFPSSLCVCMYTSIQIQTHACNNNCLLYSSRARERKIEMRREREKGNEREIPTLYMYKHIFVHEIVDINRTSSSSAHVYSYILQFRKERESEREQSCLHEILKFSLSILMTLKANLYIYIQPETILVKKIQLIQSSDGMVLYIKHICLGIKQRRGSI